MILIKLPFFTLKHLNIDTTNLCAHTQDGHWIKVLAKPMLLYPNDFIYSRRQPSANEQDWSWNYKLKYSNMQLDYRNKQLEQQDRQSKRQCVS